MSTRRPRAVPGTRTNYAAKVCEMHNELCSREEQIGALQNERTNWLVKDANQCRKIEELDGKVRALSGQLDGRRESLTSIKRLVSDLEKQLADAQGYIRAMQDQQRHDSPIIEVPQPPMMVTRAQAVANTSDGAFRVTPDYTSRPATDWRNAEANQPKHWTAL